MPTLPRPEQVVATLDERVRGHRNVDLRLTVAATALKALQPLDGFREANRLLVHKAADLQAAIADVSASIQQLRDFEGIVRFTEIGWPARRDEIATLCQE